jgi:hypothetical protein
MRYEAVFYNGWIEPPAYYLLGEAEGDSVEDAFANSLNRLTDETRRLFGLDSTDIRRIHANLYLVQPNSFVSASSLG